VPFPKIVLPVAAIAAGIPQFAFGLVPLFAMMAIGILLAAFSVFGRDTGRLSGYVLRLWFYLSPALYSTERIDRLTAPHPIIGYTFRLNPFTVLFEADRDLICRGQFPDPIGLSVLFIGSLTFLALAVIAFKRLEPAFAKLL
jgi:homopolymeric O-antigen transport system permease protein